MAANFLKDSSIIRIIYWKSFICLFFNKKFSSFIFFCSQKGPVNLSYKIYESTIKITKIELDPSEKSASVNFVNNNNINNINNNNWKEVQLRISENGEMSITGIETNLDSSLLEIVNSDPKSKQDDDVNILTSKDSDSKEKGKFF